MEPGEIHPSSVARLEAAQLQKMAQSGQTNLEARSPTKLSSGSPANRSSLYVVGLEREGGGNEIQVGVKNASPYNRNASMTVAIIIRNSWAWKNLKSTNARGPRSAFMLTAIQVDTESQMKRIRPEITNHSLKDLSNALDATL